MAKRVPTVTGVVSLATETEAKSTSGLVEVTLAVVAAPILEAAMAGARPGKITARSTWALAVPEAALAAVPSSQEAVRS